MAAGGLFLLGGTLSLTSTVLAWWSLRNPGGTVSFYTYNIQTSGNGASNSSSYAAAGLGHVGGMYDAILALVVIAGILGVVAGLISLRNGMGRGSPSRKGTVKRLAIATLVLALFAVALAPAMQPWVLHQTPGNCGGMSAPTPCASFWGSETVLGNSYSWGAAAGWYLALGALIVVVMGVILWALGRDRSRPAPMDASMS
jgi:hypothetical protein